MRRIAFALSLIGWQCIVGLAAEPGPAFRKLQLTDKFYCEGAYYADFNRDGRMDVVAGPYWYEGPDFRQRHEIRPAKEFDPKGYSDNFLTYTGDFNGDGTPDVIVGNKKGTFVFLSRPSK